MSDTLRTGELAGWESAIRIVTNGCGQLAVVDGQNDEMVLFGPTTYFPAVANYVRDYLADD